MEIIEAASAAEMEVARTLFREYEADIGIDLCFQSFEQELASLPGKYAPPHGRLLLSRDDGNWCGCVAIRPLSDDICELKRLFVRSNVRSAGVGRTLLTAALVKAESIGYRAIRLDTLPTMDRAIRMYRAHGFREIAPYTVNPVEGALFFERPLSQTEP